LRDRKQSNDYTKSGAGQRRDQLYSRKIDASKKRSKEEHIPNPVLALTGRKWPAAVYPSATQGENNGEQPPEGDAQAFGLFNEAPAEDSGSGEAGKSNGHQKSQPRNHERIHHTQAPVQGKLLTDAFDGYRQLQIVSISTFSNASGVWP
jgi:hypothetical protein